MTLRNWLLEQSLVYRLWQLPFAERKLAPLVRRGEILRAKRVLDVGCGPGTNARYFASADYLGVDINPRYIEDARQRYGRNFVVADVTKFSAADHERFDFIFVNSLLHHLDTEAVRRLLSHLATLLSDEGHAYILDLVLPPERVSPAKMLARLDRGEYPRPLSEWRHLFGEAFDVVEFEPYPLGIGGLTLWSMVYCKGRARNGTA